MSKQAIQEKPDRPESPHNKKVEANQSTKRFTDEERKKKESKQRSLGGF